MMETRFQGRQTGKTTDLLASLDMRKNNLVICPIHQMAKYLFTMKKDMEYAKHVVAKQLVYSSAKLIIQNRMTTTETVFISFNDFLIKRLSKREWLEYNKYFDEIFNSIDIAFKNVKHLNGTPF